MATTIPVPIQFELPDGWAAVPPDDVGAPDSAFVAVHPPADQGFTANISISGAVRTDDAALEQLADEAVQRLERSLSNVELVRRNEVGSEANPGLTQVVRFTAEGGGTPLSLLQMQVFLAMSDVREPGRGAVVEIVLSATVEEFPDRIGEFQTFLDTVRTETDRG